MKEISITFRDEGKNELGAFHGLLNESETGSAVWDLLPITYRICYWGQSLWIQLPIDISYLCESSEVDIGDIVYWVPGKQVQIYYGKTPISKNERPEVYSPVIKIGALCGNPIDLGNFLKRIPRRQTYITLKKRVKGAN